MRGAGTDSLIAPGSSEVEFVTITNEMNNYQLPGRGMQMILPRAFVDAETRTDLRLRCESDDPAIIEEAWEELAPTLVLSTEPAD